MTRLGLGAVAAVLAAFALAPARAEVAELRIAEEFGVSYLPLTLMREDHLIEAAARDAGLGDIKVTWTKIGDGPQMNDALLSNSLDFASGGVAPMISLWSLTGGQVKGVASLNSMPLYLNTIDPAVKTVADFTESDRIALPAVRTSMQAVLLQMAAAQAFGAAQATRLDHLTVSMKHPDGMAALLSGHSEITAHFTGAPFMYQELDDPRVHRVLDSYDVMGGPHTFNLVWTSQAFRTANPKTYAAFVAALAAADDEIAKDPARAAAVYVKAEASSLSPAYIRKILVDPENRFTVVPQNTLRYAGFMRQIGAIPTAPSKWSDMFFPDLAGAPGS